MKTVEVNGKTYTEDEVKEMLESFVVSLWETFIEVWENVKELMNEFVNIFEEQPKIPKPPFRQKLPVFIAPPVPKRIRIRNNC